MKYEVSSLTRDLPKHLAARASQWLRGCCRLLSGMSTVRNTMREMTTRKKPRASHEKFRIAVLDPFRHESCTVSISLITDDWRPEQTINDDFPGLDADRFLWNPDNSHHERDNDMQFTLSKLSKVTFETIFKLSENKSLPSTGVAKVEAFGTRLNGLMEVDSRYLAPKVAASIPTADSAEINLGGSHSLWSIPAVRLLSRGQPWTVVSRFRFDVEEPSLCFLESDREVLCEMECNNM